MKQQRINTSYQKKKPLIIDERQPEVPKEIPRGSNLPVRSVVFVEVGDAEPLRVQCLIQEINGIYKTARGGVHYVIPVRNGKIKTDILFEKEFLDVVNKVCEVRDNNIVMKNGEQEVQVLREVVK